jgi:NADH-quinone oxidoreductase subunit C
MNVPDQEFDEFGQTIVTKTREAFPDAVQQVIHFLDELTVVLKRESVVDVCTFLRDDPQLEFNVMCDLCAVDMWPKVPRFEVNIHLLQLPRHHPPAQGTRRLRVKVRLEEHDASMPTLTGVWPSAAWYERETCELFGMSFEGHPDPRPLLLPEDWKGLPPLRRDVPVHVEEVAFSFNQERIYRQKPFAKE